MLGVTVFGIFFTPVFYSVIRWLNSRGAAPRKVVPVLAEVPAAAAELAVARADQPCAKSLRPADGADGRSFLTLNGSVAVAELPAPPTKERSMNTARKAGLALYVERSQRRWVVRDPDGNFWIVPPGDQPWDQRLPYEPTEEAELEPVPGHYISMLGLHV